MPNSDGRFYPSLLKPWSNINTKAERPYPVMGTLPHRWEPSDGKAKPSMGSHDRCKSFKTLVLYPPSSLPRSRVPYPLSAFNMTNYDVSGLEPISEGVSKEKAKKMDRTKKHTRRKVLGAVWQLLNG
ncbi:unnamed protein product [Cuscuta campestris]|uniref:Uncharacterized protein n=1 Tax=Cuscuta campestris TaxID=132261 RepID=A0A484NMA7_9ASTE|nr:unnamed protein product [Cuscuta campestris]